MRRRGGKEEETRKCLYESSRGGEDSLDSICMRLIGRVYLPQRLLSLEADVFSEEHRLREIGESKNEQGTRCLPTLKATGR